MTNDLYEGNDWVATRLSVAATHEALDKMFTAVGEGDVSASQERLAAICRLYENAKTASDAALFEVMPYLAGVAEGGEAVKDLQHNFAKLEKLCQSPNDAIAALKEIRETLSEIRTLLTVIDA